MWKRSTPARRLGLPPGVDDCGKPVENYVENSGAGEFSTAFHNAARGFSTILWKRSARGLRDAGSWQHAKRADRPGGRPTLLVRLRCSRRQRAKSNGSERRRGGPRAGRVSERGVNTRPALESSPHRRGEGGAGVRGPMPVPPRTPPRETESFTFGRPALLERVRRELERRLVSSAPASRLHGTAPGVHAKGPRTWEIRPSRPDTSSTLSWS